MCCWNQRCDFGPERGPDEELPYPFCFEDATNLFDCIDQTSAECRASSPQKLRGQLAGYGGYLTGDFSLYPRAGGLGFRVCRVHCGAASCYNRRAFRTVYERRMRVQQARTMTAHAHTKRTGCSDGNTGVDPRSNMAATLKPGAQGPFCAPCAGSWPVKGRRRRTRCSGPSTPLAPSWPRWLAWKGSTSCLTIPGYLSRFRSEIHEQVLVDFLFNCP